VPSSTSRPGGRTSRLLAIFALVVVAVAAYAGLRAGTFLYAEDPLKDGDAIYVLAGSRIVRPLEAVDLYLEGRAPLVVLSQPIAQPGMDVLDARGIELSVPTDLDVTLEVARQLGVPDEAILTTRVHDNTAEEAVTLRELATARGWRTVIVVSSKLHLRRAGYAMRRELEGTGVEVVMRGTRYDPANPARWWAARADMRFMLSEVPKLGAYWLGLGE
jgi:uncharacterized SAM-binding protein YcdF (DUF218 family)